MIQWKEQQPISQKGCFPVPILPWNSCMTLVNSFLLWTSLFFNLENESLRSYPFQFAYLYNTIGAIFRYFHDNGEIHLLQQSTTKLEWWTVGSLKFVPRNLLNLLCEYRNKVWDRYCIPMHFLRPEVEESGSYFIYHTFPGVKVPSLEFMALLTY